MATGDGALPGGKQGDCSGPTTQAPHQPRASDSRKARLPTNGWMECAADDDGWPKKRGRWRVGTAHKRPPRRYPSFSARGARRVAGKHGCRRAAGRKVRRPTDRGKKTRLPTGRVVVTRRFLPEMRGAWQAIPAADERPAGNRHCPDRASITILGITPTGQSASPSPIELVEECPERAPSLCAKGRLWMDARKRRKTPRPKRDGTPSRALARGPVFGAMRPICCCGFARGATMRPCDGSRLAYGTF